SAGTEANALSLLATNPDLGREEQILLGEEAIAVARTSGDRWLLGLATGNQGSHLIELGGPGRGRDLTEEAERICRGVGDVSLTVLWLASLSTLAIQADDAVEARARLNESLDLARLIDDTRGVGVATVGLGWVELLEGNVDRACSRFEEAADIA